MGNEPAVLIVDDDAGILETMSDILKELHFKVTVANDGFKAIELVKNGTFDAILMDIRMPGIDGVETFKRIKRIRPGSKIIFMTAYAFEELVTEAKREGATAVLYKPIDIGNLEKMLRNAKPNGSKPQKFQQFSS